MNGRGTLSLPVTLAVAVAMVAVATPIVLAQQEGFSHEREMDGVKEEARRIIAQADRMWYAGTGSREEVSVHIGPGYSLCFGGEGAEQWSYCIMHGDDVIERIYTDSPKVRFIGSTYIDGYCTLTVSCENCGGYGIRVAVG